MFVFFNPRAFLSQLNLKIVDALKREIAGFTRHQPQRDDMTMVVIKVE